MYHFGLARVHCVDGERHGVLHTVEIIVEACAGEQEERGCYATQVKFLGQCGLKRVFDHLDGYFGGLGEEFASIFSGMMSDMLLVDVLNVL